MQSGSGQRRARIAGAESARDGVDPARSSSSLSWPSLARRPRARTRPLVLPADTGTGSCCRRTRPLITHRRQSPAVPRPTWPRRSSARPRFNHIFGKLDAESRVQVVARARTLGLLAL